MLVKSRWWIFLLEDDKHYNLFNRNDFGRVSVRGNRRYKGGVLRSRGRQPSRLGRALPGGRDVGPWGVDGGRGVQGPPLVHQLDVGVAPEPPGSSTGRRAILRGVG